ncbi:hypothetical protein J4H86_19605 [Spiractinospora alimapuensis]|uniref:hypothetical protein n=1 Tax=Spiractinospora alimapuensis TaxID=2820884 RepID=UPI001F1BB457|nr:hypothetical protein [Spiractinospora alimapuensis]QVQ51031.1 hypothetical protein J4H86_19605 [Spiractinospora alimapuensis]
MDIVRERRGLVDIVAVGGGPFVVGAVGDLHRSVRHDRPRDRTRLAAVLDGWRGLMVPVGGRGVVDGPGDGCHSLVAVVSDSDRFLRFGECPGLAPLPRGGRGRVDPVDVGGRIGVPGGGPFVVGAVGDLHWPVRHDRLRDRTRLAAVSGGWRGLVGTVHDNRRLMDSVRVGERLVILRHR